MELGHFILYLMELGHFTLYLMLERYDGIRALYTVLNVREI